MSDLLAWRSESHRLVASSGSIDIGAVFPPLSGKKWRWRAFFGGSTATFAMAGDGRNERSEQAAKAAVEGKWREFLAAAGLELRAE